ncbi:hypothetical protein FTO68_02325 [Methanocalculus taiwanensis]|uniref:CRISPR-associated protein n=1 Tax=Methanocalculus taiwanensis TaxID=106207 RepID=A0ABD4TKG5_9EURY|nr:hypothetical protein [Methanocalculus taiwanensis]MCQ1537825.1 hypothetical protein [Methanocalculus taiwanensis]
MHLHIISAGESIHGTFPTALKNLERITHVAVVVEKDIYSEKIDDSLYLKKTKPKIQESISKVKVQCKTIAVTFSEVKIEDTSLISVRNAILELITHYNPENLRLSFNLSGGTKQLSLSLFVMAIWLDGEVYLTPEEESIKHFSIPKMYLRDIRKNPNYVQALVILGDYMGLKMNTNNKNKWMPGKAFAKEMISTYTTIRFKDDKKQERTPHRGTITKILSPLIEWELVEERQRPNNKREKEYRLTQDGIFALSILCSEGRSLPITNVDN